MEPNDPRSAPSRRSRMRGLVPERCDGLPDPGRRECRFRPQDHFANVLSTSKFERHLLPPHRCRREGREPTRGLVDVGRPSGLLPEGDAVLGRQLPKVRRRRRPEPGLRPRSKPGPWAAEGSRMFPDVRLADCRASQGRCRRAVARPAPQHAETGARWVSRAPSWSDVPELQLRLCPGQGRRFRYHAKACMSERSHQRQSDS